ncbi:hypothetical protein DXA95_04565 [Odoribacter sp. OF09-27XD]|jgi:hypothetical protein|nr:hypothetical protein [Odoribacter sp. OF09-27XD]RHV96948.1 hypothetical protein DXA95_04565 [Odoribacter sp. OF09-27XD]
MEKLRAILSNMDFTDNMIDLRGRCIIKTIESFSNSVEKQINEAEIHYNGLCKKLGNIEVDPDKTIKDMLGQKHIIHRCKEVIDILKEIRADLESDVKLKR